ncbi:outer membrane beta-barrel protein, partial [Klebsiella pneumoniae]
TDQMTLRVDFDFGDTADATHRNANGVVDETSKNIGQAIITWAPKSVNGLTVNVGKMATHMGLETTKSK